MRVYTVRSNIPEIVAEDVPDTTVMFGRRVDYCEYFNTCHGQEGVRCFSDWQLARTYFLENVTRRRVDKGREAEALNIEIERLAQRLAQVHEMEQPPHDAKWRLSAENGGR